MQQKYIRLPNRRLKFLPHWIQAQCRRCGAWLNELPDRDAPLSPTSWSLSWTCLTCSFEYSQTSGEPAIAFQPDPEAILEPPGSMPPWSQWRLPYRLVGHLCIVAARFALDTPPASLRGVRSVLDHDGVRRTDWGTFLGDDEDPTGLRLALARLRHTPKRVAGARLACVLAERAVLAVGAAFEQLARAEPLAASIARNHADARCECDRMLVTPFVSPADLSCGVPVAPVIGSGRLSIASRYEDWLLEEGSHPWFTQRHAALRRAPIPAGTEFAASCIELADVILQSLDLLDCADTEMQLLGDVARLQTLLGLWRSMQMGQWHTDWRWDRHWPKLPNPFWLHRWKQPPSLSMW